MKQPEHSPGAPADDSIRILLVDDHRLIRDGIKFQLGQTPELKVVGEAASGAKALELARQLRPDVVLLDIRLAGSLNGFQTCAELKKLKPVPRVVLVSGECREEHWRLVDECGADGFVQKECETQDYPGLVRQVFHGEFALSASLARQAFKALATMKAPGVLTDSDNRLMGLVAEGLTNDLIAAKLHKSSSTVAHQLSDIARKLGTKGRRQAVELWRKYMAAGAPR